jgi:hypothetical protein
MGAELIVIFLIAGACRGLVQQTKRDLAKWRTRPPAKRGTRWWNRPLTAGDVGYWGHQAAHGFPTARAGVTDGLSRARQAHHQARRDIAQARAEHAEGRADLHPELENFRQRRREALERLWEKQRYQPEAAPGPAPEPPEPPAPAEPPAAEAAAEDHEDDGEAAAHAETSDLPEEDEEPEDPAAGWDDPLPTERKHAMSDSKSDSKADAKAQAEQAEYDHQQQDNSHGVMGRAPNPGENNHKGDGNVSETTYKGVKARMASAQTAAEQRQAEAKAAQAGCEERVSEAEQAKAWAQATSEEMQSLDVDAAVLNAMAEHLDAADKALQVEQELLEAAAQAWTAWSEVVETAGQVTSQLEASGHGQLDEAHENAAAGGAEKAFYGEGG